MKCVHSLLLLKVPFNIRVSLRSPRKLYGGQNIFLSGTRKLLAGLSFVISDLVILTLLVPTWITILLMLSHIVWEEARGATGQPMEQVRVKKRKL